MDIGLIFPNYCIFDTSCGGTQEDRHASCWKCLLLLIVSVGRKIRQCDKKMRGNGIFYGREGVDFTLPRKTSQVRT